MTTIAACLKWVDRRPELERSGRAAVVRTDARSAGASDADRAALEWALRAADTVVPRATVLALAAGPVEAESVLRDALAAGVDDAIRVELAPGAPSSIVAAALAPALTGCALVWCGDHSLDRGSGSVPAYLAAELKTAQALGLVEVTLGASPSVEGIRRLDGGRRERLRLPEAGGVVSVEGSTAQLRRAGLTASLGARGRTIRVVQGPVLPERHPPLYRPFRPRARVLPAPSGETSLERIAALTDTTGHGRGDATVLTPDEAAQRILEALAEWGYELPAPP